MCFCLVERHVTIAEHGRAAFFFAGGQLFFHVCVLDRDGRGGDEGARGSFYSERH